MAHLQYACSLKQFQDWQGCVCTAELQKIVQNSCTCGPLYLRFPFSFEHLQTIPFIISLSMIAALLPIITGSRAKQELMSDHHW